MGSKPARGYPAECSPAGAARGSASVSHSGLAQALIAMMVSQQEGMQILASQLQCIAQRQADNATALTRAMSSLEQSMVAIAGEPRKRLATEREIGQEFYICSEGER